MLPTSLQNCDICKTAFNNVPEYIRVEPIMCCGTNKKKQRMKLFDSKAA